MADTVSDYEPQFPRGYNSQQPPRMDMISLSELLRQEKIIEESRTETSVAHIIKQRDQRRAEIADIGKYVFVSPRNIEFKLTNECTILIPSREVDRIHIEKPEFGFLDLTIERSSGRGRRYKLAMGHYHFHLFTSPDTWNGDSRAIKSATIEY